MTTSDGIQPPRRLVAVLATPQVVPFDLAAPCDVFRHARALDGASLYDVRVCAETPRVDAGLFEISAAWGLDVLDTADTIVIAGTTSIDCGLSDAATASVLQAAERGARIASVCSGAFLLAGTGLLDGRRATTHWLAAAELARRFPRVEVEPDRLYVDEGAVLTSAGAAASIDLCLHMIRSDHGGTIAADAARLSVVPLEREGGQAQFVARPAPVDPESLAPLLEWIEERFADDLTLADMAQAGHISVRTLTRRFKDQLGVSPLQWLSRVRVRRAQAMLETGRQSIDSIAQACGFGSTPTFRQHFKKIVSVSPSHWRRSFAARPT